MNLLVEIGTEELPLAALDVIYAELGARAEALLRENRLSHGKIKVEATARRVVLFVEGLASVQQEVTLELRGPAYDKAYDAQGRPTPALLGFLKSKSAELSEVKNRDTPKGKFVFLQKKEKVKSAASVLSLLLPEIFSSLSFPKLMRWEPSGFRFPRPVRWAVALLDGKTISFKLGKVKANNRTYGHRFLAPKPVVVKRAEWRAYIALLKRNHVILELSERESLIRKGLEKRYHQHFFDEELVHTTAQIVEEPFLMEGAFSKTYLELPSEVLASCMKKNQKIFACYGPKRQMTNRFVAVLNGRRSGLGRVRSDYENVLESRLRDARFFYEADTKEPLESKLGLLNQIVYLGKLGTMLDKTERLEKFSEIFSRLLGREDLRDNLKRAARLSKADLMTHMVFEFPDLQGLMGREYALESREKEDVAKALGTQYLPKNLAQDYRELAKSLTPMGAIFGVLDRLDLLVGAFGTGLEPTGSQDPYALRRAGGALVKLVRAFRFHFSLKEAMDAGISLYGPALNVPVADLGKKLLEFFKERVIFEIAPKPGSRPFEILNAVMHSSFDDLADVYDRNEALNRIHENDPQVFLRAAKVVERTANILKGVKGQVGDVQPGLFNEALEKELYQLISDKSAEMAVFLSERDYEKATYLLSRDFADPLHRFFEQVMVNVEDVQIRANRQALMKKIYGLYGSKVADLSLLSRIE